MRSFAALSLCLLLGAGCAAGDMNPDDAGADAQMVWPDGGPDGRDAGPGEDAGDPRDAGDRPDGAPADPDGGGTDAGGDPDAGPLDGGAADPDAGSLDGGGAGCPGIHSGDTIALDGSGDLAAYPSEQILNPHAPYVAGADQYGITWDAEHLYVTLVASGLADDEFRPLHVYVEAASGSLPAASPAMGKEYGGQTPAFAFSPTHLIAVRRTSDSGSGGPYNGVYEAASSWSVRETPLASGTDTWVASGGTAISIRVPWSALGCPARIRLSAHVVNQVIGEDWKDLIPVGAQPWNPTDGPGSYYEIDLSADPAVSGWTEVTP
ncbi:MAG TPA: hypothetical protein RMH99_16710 [Sandaracinaceae bacterium LLY-WYZ-13_1]|nr:hypothetical protein [Sandaracinaceae bacterium LLY-WYZ-13_1]